MKSTDYNYKHFGFKHYSEESTGRFLLERFEGHKIGPKIGFVHKHLAQKILILVLIFTWIFSGWSSFNLWTSDVHNIEISRAQETTSTLEAATSTLEIATSTSETASSTPVETTTSTTPSFAEAATSTPAQTATSTSETATSTPEILLVDTATSTDLNPGATSTEITTATSSPQEEKPVKKQNLLANLFGAFWDVLFGEDNSPQTAETEDKIFAEKISGDVRVEAIVRNSKAELWISDLEKKNWQKIANEEMISENSPIGLDGGLIFWLSPDQKALVVFDTLSQVYFSQSIEPWGDTIIEFNSKKYILLIQNNNIMLTPQAYEDNF